MSSPAPAEKPLFIPVILGTPREGRLSEHVANFLAAEVAKRPGVETELIDIRTLGLSITDAGESMKHALDTNLKEYIHKAVGICGVSAGPWGGTRVVQNMLPVMRELGLVTIFWDGNFSSVQNV